MTEMTESAADLQVPEASVIARCEGVDINVGNDEHDIRRVAAPVVAAELRRIAAPHAPHPATGSVDYDCGYALACDAWVKALRARADELDPPAGRED